MKVLFVLDHAGRGGIPGLVAPLVKILRSDPELELEICFIHQLGPYVDKFREEGLPIHFVGVRNRWDIVHALALTKIIRKGGFDVVDAHAFHPFPRLAMVLARPRALVLHEHGNIMSDVVREKRANLWFGRLMRNTASRYVALGKNSADSLTRYHAISPDKIAIIHTAVDTERFNPNNFDRTEARAQFGIDPSQPVVGTTRSLWPKNAVDHVVRAAPAILKWYPNTVFLIAGDGPLRSGLESLAQELGVAGSFRFIGLRDDVPAVLAAMDVFVLPSIWEGTSLSAIEAQSMGLPVVAYDVGGNRETFVDGVTGRLLPKRDPALLAQAVVDLLSDLQVLAEAGVKARRRIQEQFAVKMIAKRYKELFRTLMHNNDEGSAVD